jgi:hypothetical protein
MALTGTKSRENSIYRNFENSTQKDKKEILIQSGAGATPLLNQIKEKMNHTSNSFFPKRRTSLHFENEKMSDLTFDPERSTHFDEHGHQVNQFTYRKANQFTGKKKSYFH